MSQKLSPAFVSPVTPNTFSNPSVPRRSGTSSSFLPPPVPKNGSARTTGLISPNAQIVSTGIPTRVTQTVNSPLSQSPPQSPRLSNLGPIINTVQPIPSPMLVPTVQSIPVLLSSSQVFPIVPPSPIRSPLVPPSPTRSPMVPPSPTRTVIVPLGLTRSPMVPPSPTRSPMIPLSPTRSPMVPPSPTRTVIVPLGLTRSPMVPPSPTLSPIVPPSPTRSLVVPLALTRSPMVPPIPTRSPIVPVSPTRLQISPPSPIRLSVSSIAVPTVSTIRVPQSPMRTPIVPPSPRKTLSPIIPTNPILGLFPEMSPNTVTTSQKSTRMSNQGDKMMPCASPVVPTMLVDKRAMMTVKQPSLRIARTSPEAGLVVMKKEEYEIRDYQGIVKKSSIENELLTAGYGPLSKIVVKEETGENRTQYIKSINKKGQTVFVMIDAHGYTSTRATDLTLVQSNVVSVVPYSLKTGAYDCAGKDVCGVAFECGTDSVCVLARGTKDMTPTEANFVYVEKQGPAAASIEANGSIMTYPVIKLTEIRANPGLVLSNTDAVTRRLRNTQYSGELQDLATTQKAIGHLNESFTRFNGIREVVSIKLMRTLAQLEQWNEIYLINPPMTDDLKDRYRRLQANLAQRNEGIANLLRIMKRAADKRVEIERIAKEMTELSDMVEREFANVEYASTE